jgi:hypothetical protein
MRNGNWKDEEKDPSFNGHTVKDVKELFSAQKIREALQDGDDRSMNS